MESESVAAMDYAISALRGIAAVLNQPVQTVQTCNPTAAILQGDCRVARMIAADALERMGAKL